MKRKHSISLTILLTLAVAFCQMKAHASANAAESIAENASESIAENVTDNTAESAAESAAESTAENVTESTAENAPESTVENAPESTAENAAESTPEKAAENAPKNVTVPTVSSELISVELPMIEERNPFNFFIDPLHIFYNTFSNSGGDITVEEDTCLLFYNRHESGDALSSRSDSLEIINRSTVPIEVTITAKIENAGGIAVVQDKDFADRNSCDLYLALVDNEGNEQPLSGDGEVSIAVYLDRAPLDAYAYVLNEDTGEYQYVCQSEDVAFDTYSFGLIGACNEKGDWANISGRPHVTISWNVEPVVPEGSEIGKKSDKESDKEPGEGSKEGSDEKPDEEPEKESNEGPGEESDKKPEDISENSAADSDVEVKNDLSTGGQTETDSEDSVQNRVDSEASAEDTVDGLEGSVPENGISDAKGTTEDSGFNVDSSTDVEGDSGDNSPTDESNLTDKVNEKSTDIFE